MTYTKIYIKEDSENENSIRIDRDRLIPIECRGGFDFDNGRSNAIDVRGTGDLAYKAIYLSETHDWVLGRDKEDMLCLVPLKKEA